MAIEVGIVGYGLSGSVFHAPFIHSMEGFDLKAVVSSKPEKVHKDFPEVEVVPGLEGLIQKEDIRLVIITTPTYTHYDYVKQALKAGKHVVVEKPFTVTSSEAEELIQLAKAQNVLLTVYQNRRWDGDFLTVKRLVESGELGSIALFESRFDRFRPQVQQRWKEQDVGGSGLLYDLGAHLIDQAVKLFGMPEAVFADLARQRKGAEATDYFQITLFYGTMRAILSAGSLVRQPGPRFEVHGDRGSYIKYGLDPQEGALREGAQPGEKGWAEESQADYGTLVYEVNGLPAESRIRTERGRYEAFYESLRSAIEHGTEPPVNPSDSKRVIQLIECAMLSSQKQKVIRIKE